MIADQRARGREEREALLAGAGRPHLGQLGPALAELVDHRAGELLVDVDHDLLDRLQRLAGLRVGRAAARAAGRSRARSPRGAWSRSAPRAAARRGPATSKASPAGAGLTRIATLPSASRCSRSAIRRERHLVALLAGERRIVDREGHRQRRRVDRLRRERASRPRGRTRCRRRWRGRSPRARRCRRPRPPPARPARGRGRPGAWSPASAR